MCRLPKICFSQGDTFKKSIQATDANDVPIDWSLIPDVTASFRDLLGNVMATFSIGSGLQVNPDDSTDLWLLSTAETIALCPRHYEYDLKIPFTVNIINHSPTGTVQVFKTVTP